MKDKIDALNLKFLHSPVDEILQWFSNEYSGRITFSTSLGAEDQAIIFLLAKLKLPVKIFTLDTGRLFQETYDIHDITQKKYGLSIKVYFPDAPRVEEMVNGKGINLFYESVENRRLCCQIRKIEPLKRALTGMEVWITGLRKEQSVTRSNASLVEWDESFGIMKLNPLIHWDSDELQRFVTENRIPLNELHTKGYPSIGCMPCTRPVKPGEDVRAGRWWWELPQNKECGLHK